MPARSVARERFSFANLDEVLPLPDLIAIQRDSFKWFLDRGLADTFRDISPIEDFTGQLRLELEFDAEDPDLRPPPKFAVEECKEKDMTYSAPIFVRARFMNATTGEIKEQTVFMGDFPMMTDKGTFIINGTERVVVSQLVRSPGVIFQPGRDAKTYATGTIHPYRGEWIEFDVEAKPGKDVTAGTRVARKRRLSLFVLLRALGFGEEDYPGFLDRFVRHFDFLEGQWEKDRDLAPTKEESLVEIYKRARPGEPPSPESARAYFENAFFNPKRYDLTRVGRYKLNRKLGPEIEKISALFDVDLERPAPDQGVLAQAEMLAATTYLLHLANGEAGYRLDDQDHFANRRIRSVGELIQNQVRIGLSRMERVVRERMTTQDVEAITPQTLINIRPVVAAIKEFFGTSQLSQFMDQVNPLSGLAHKRRLSALGPGGLSRERAGFEVRDVHSSHYGRMCPIETPEGPNIGLIGALATYGRVNEYGFIETPYRKVVEGRVTDEIVYMTADEEEEFVIAQANAALDDDGNFTEERILCRRGPQGAAVRLGGGASSYGTTSEIDVVSPTEVDFMDVSPKQTVSVSTALIPFIEHDDANRALMGANMQKQAVPLLRPEAPYIGTGIEARAARDAGDMVLAEGDGTISEVAGDHITIEYNPNQKDRLSHPLGRKVYRLAKFDRSNQDTCINQKVLVHEGQKVKKGEVLADGASTHNGELALGKNLLVAFMPWEGYNYEDAIILSERLVKDDVLTSIHIEKHEVDARDTKLGAEEITRDIPNLSEEILKDLDERGIIRIGAEVGPGDVLVGKVTPKGETELTPEERLLRAIFGEKAREVRDTSLKVPHGQTGKVISVQVFSRDDAHELPPGVNQLVRVYIAQKRKISEGDKLAGRHGNKGVISKILPIEDMPHLADGTPVDIILNPLGVPSRMNVGQVLEAHLGYAARWGWPEASNGQVAARGTESKTRPRTDPAVWVATPVFDGAHWDEEVDAGRHPTMKKIFEDINPESIDGERMIGPDGKATLYNGRTGEPYDNPISVGYVYILKLAHLVDDKIHARSTGPYSMITQQPLGGKAQFGGQRFGEMEVWALEAYGAAYALQELLTIKSDDVLGRVKVYEAIVKGENIPEPGIPESFKVLIKEMQSLCLNVEVLSNTGEEIEMRELDEDVFRTAEELGISIERPERGSDEEDAERERRRAERSSY
ncbi:MAG: DNA-directed RNA polymerase subunit beta [Actinobacteria bacterium]|nr:DNA-directed RNA polymerase subunit beta [Actinomycetota bacterium]MBW3650422.1 DNA-directed RNA polymerase subunit beta [Actinomycetota bacterium]